MRLMYRINTHIPQAVPIHAIRYSDIEPFFGRTSQMKELDNLFQKDWDLPNSLNYRAAIHGPAGSGYASCILIETTLLTIMD